MRVRGRWTRRELLRSLAVAAGTACLPGISRAAPALSLTTFMDLSRQSTGFAQLDTELGRRYLVALSVSEPRLAEILTRWEAGRRDWGRDEEAVIDAVIACWYTGTMPTARGVEVVSFAAALGQACLPRPTPVTFCR